MLILWLCVLLAIAGRSGVAHPVISGDSETTDHALSSHEDDHYTSSKDHGQDHGNDHNLSDPDHDFTVNSVDRGCFEKYNQTVITTKQYYKDGPLINETEIRPRERCCKDHIMVGDICVMEPDPNNPCVHLTCPEDPTAECIVVRKCGQMIAMFINSDDKSLSSVCNHETVYCNGVCTEDPCDSLKCDAYPEAVCFTSGCDCQAVWYLYEDSGPGKQVDCHNTERARRQTDCAL